jgi:Tol biopolymer transport system component
VRALLALVAALLLLSVGPGATASTSTPPKNGLIAVSGSEGLYVIDPRAGTTKLLPESLELTDPAWSPDGTTLAASSLDGQSVDLYTMKPDGTERLLVLKNAYSPSWSPDGKQLVVVRETAEGDADGTELAIVDADGSRVRNLDLGPAKNSVLVAAPEWSPDGKLIAFVDLAEGMIEFVSPDGEAASKPVVAADATGLSWSPDSTRLAFDRLVETKEGERSVAVVRDVASGNEAVFTGEQDGAMSPTWSPEGDQIAFMSMIKASSSTTTTPHSCGGESFVSHLWAMLPDGTKAHRLVEGEYSGGVSWARSLEAEKAAPADTEPEQQALPAPPVVTAPEPQPLPAPAAREAAAPEVATPVTAKPRELSSKTGGLIAVRGSTSLYLTDPTGGATRKIPDTADMVAPAWSPDAKLLAVERVGKGESSIWTIRPDGTNPQLVLPNASLPSWSPEGDRIYAVRGECATQCELEEDAVLLSVRADGTEVQKVDVEDFEAGAGRDFPWAPDGSSIGFFADESASNPGTFDSSEAAWSPEGTSLAFVGTVGPFDEDAGDAPPEYGLWVVSAEGGTPQLLVKGASGRPSWAAK